MKGTLYVIGVGPGDPELLTLKAARILGEVSCLCVPRGREEGSSLALSIVQKALSIEGKEIIEAHFPMQKTKRIKVSKHQSIKGSDPLTLCRSDPFINHELDAKWNETADAVMKRLNRGIDVAFITIGDPTIYSTFFYLYDKLFELDLSLNIEIIPGVSSINASAARAGISLGLADEKIAVVPATYTKDMKEILKNFDTVVFMKVNKVFDEIIKALEETDFIGKATYISRAFMEDEKIFKNIKEVKKEDLNYFSVVIIRK